VPGALAARVAALAVPANWKVTASRAVAADLAAALHASADGRLVLFSPPSASIPERLAQMLVPHDGTPATSAALQAIRYLSPGNHTEVVALHVAATHAPSEPGSFPALRMVDHDGHDWREWREEFRRRFFRCPPGVPVRLQVTAGLSPDVIVRTARMIPADLIVMAWGGVLKAGRAMTLRAVCETAPCPVLLVPAPRGGRTYLRMEGA
jgi:nucleotide-binding universal stress UspA family protein